MAFGKKLVLEGLERRDHPSSTLITVPPADSHPNGVAAIVQNMPNDVFKGMSTATIQSNFVVILVIESGT